MSEASEMYESTFNALERTLTVALITEWNLIACSNQASAQEMFTEREDISQIPKRDGERIVGVWYRRDEYAPLNETMLISEATPISEFISIPGAFRLVVRRGAIQGIVTRSDLNQLPVRLLSFGVMTHLEIQMACLITKRYPHDSWLDRLDAGRRGEIEKRFKRDSAGPDWEGRTTRLGCSDLMDKFKILQAEPDIGAALTVDSKELNLLRRKLAHSDDYVWDLDEPLENFCKRYQLAQSWVARFHEILANEEKTDRSRTAAGSDQ